MPLHQGWGYHKNAWEDTPAAATYTACWNTGRVLPPVTFPLFHHCHAGGLLPGFEGGLHCTAACCLGGTAGHHWADLPGTPACCCHHRRACAPAIGPAPACHGQDYVKWDLYLPSWTSHHFTTFTTCYRLLPTGASLEEVQNTPAASGRIPACHLSGCILPLNFHSTLFILPHYLPAITGPPGGHMTAAHLPHKYHHLGHLTTLTYTTAWRRFYPYQVLSAAPFARSLSWTATCTAPFSASCHLVLPACPLPASISATHTLQDPAITGFATHTLLFLHLFGLLSCLFTTTTITTFYWTFLGSAAPPHTLKWTSTTSPLGGFSLLPAS